MVMQVLAGSNADRAGLLAGDMLTNYGKKRLTNQPFDTLPKLVTESAKKGTQTLGLEREDSALFLSVAGGSLGVRYEIEPILRNRHPITTNSLASQRAPDSLPTMNVASLPASGPAMTTPKPAGPFDQQLLGRYHALVIGNNRYENLPELKNAVGDARAVSEVLRDRYGYDVTTLLDATRRDILIEMSRLRSTLTDQDNLLIYYAGHGWLDKDADMGYWLPVEAARDNTVDWIPVTEITSNLRAMQAKHVMIVADSCYSGTLTRGMSLVQRSPGYVERIANKRARLVLTSGGLEPVVDSGGGQHSVFAAQFLNALRSNTTILDGSQLFNQIRRPVMLGADQTPEYSDIRKAGHKGGDFLFIPVGIPD